MKTISFSAVVTFQIQADEAALILSENRGGAAVNEWLSNHHCVRDPDHDGYNTATLKTELGKFLADQKIEETRLLTMPADGTAQPSPN